jgi:hypothetical protein
MIKFLIDEDITKELAGALRKFGVDAVSVCDVDINRAGLSDLKQFSYAQEQSRTLVTRNVADFNKIANHYFQKEQNFCGLVLVTFFVRLDSLGFVAKKLQVVAENNDVESIKNQIIYL